MECTGNIWLRSDKLMLIAGERINRSHIQLDEAVANREAGYNQADVKAQVEAGADLIDVRAG